MSASNIINERARLASNDPPDFITPSPNDWLKSQSQRKLHPARRARGHGLTEATPTGASSLDLGIITTKDDTLLADFNDGGGVSTVAGADIRITTHDGSTFDIDLTSAKTVGDVRSAISTATAGAVQVDFNPQGGLRLNDTTSGAGSSTRRSPCGCRHRSSPRR